MDIPEFDYKMAAKWEYPLKRAMNIGYSNNQCMEMGYLLKLYQMDIHVFFHLMEYPIICYQIPHKYASKLKDKLQFF